MTELLQQKCSWGLFCVKNLVLEAIGGVFLSSRGAHEPEIAQFAVVDFLQGALQSFLCKNALGDCFVPLIPFWSPLEMAAGHDPPPPPFLGSGRGTVLLTKSPPRPSSHCGKMRTKMAFVTCCWDEELGWRRGPEAAQNPGENAMPPSAGEYNRGGGKGSRPCCRGQQSHLLEALVLEFYRGAGGAQQNATSRGLVWAKNLVLAPFGGPLELKRHLQAQGP